MNLPVSKTFCLSASLLSVAAITISQPAKAFSVSRSTIPVFTNTFRFTTQQLDFNSLTPGAFSSAVFNGDPVADPADSNKVVITDTSSGPQGDVTIASSGANRFFQFAPQGGANVSRLEFAFDNPLAYFGVRFLNFGTNLNSTISFLDGSDLISSYTFSTLSGLSGTGNYFNFNAPLVSERFTRVVVTGQNLRLDDVAYRIPTPAMLPGLIGLGVAAWRRREGSEEHED
ncbi:hypothetical protein C7271_09400 [filamentous cyanobacterium CCP5]|nr:hypothetical protein C7271_09400 [filamentous cyanobacterium CCP5]